MGTRRGVLRDRSIFQIHYDGVQYYGTLQAPGTSKQYAAEETQSLLLCNRKLDYQSLQSEGAQSCFVFQKKKLDEWFVQECEAESAAVCLSIGNCC